MNAFRKAFGHKLTGLQNEGISLKYHPPKSPGMEGGYSWHHVTAHDPAGKQIGHVEFSEGVGTNESMPHGTEVDPAHRRKGIASAMYNHYQKMTGHKILPDDVQSDDAKALWAQKNRPFGKSELMKSPYGPKGMGLYSPADNARRKEQRSSLSATKPTTSQQAAMQARADQIRSKKNPVRTFKPHEIKALMRNGFKVPKAA